MVEERPDGTSSTWTYRGGLLDETASYDTTGTPVARTVYAYVLLSHPDHP